MKLATTALIALAVQPALFPQATPKLSLKLEENRPKTPARSGFASE